MLKFEMKILLVMLNNYINIILNQTFVKKKNKNSNQKKNINLIRMSKIKFTYFQRLTFALRHYKKLIKKYKGKKKTFRKYLLIKFF